MDNEGFGPQEQHTIGKLALALSKAQAAMKGAVKDSENPHFKSKYADLASVWDACREALTKNELSVIQLTSGGPETVTVTTILAHSSGESVSTALTIRPMKADAQGLGSAISYGRRYSLAAMVGVAPEDDDGNAASAPQKGAEKAAVKAAQEQKQANMLTLSFPSGDAKNFATASAYLDALESELSNADDPGALFDANHDLLQRIQAAAFKRKDEATVGRVKAIFDHIHAGDIPGSKEIKG